MATIAIKQVRAPAPAPEAPLPLNSFTSWWRRTADLEMEMDYAGSSGLARQVWDDTVARLMLEPSEALYLELGECLSLWRQTAPTFAQHGETFLDALVVAAFVEGVTLPDHPGVAASKLKQMLHAHRRDSVRPRLVRRA